MTQRRKPRIAPNGGPGRVKPGGPRNPCAIVARVDERIRIHEVEANDTKHPCAKCPKRFMPRARKGGFVISAVYVCRNGQNFDFSGYLCPECVSVVCGKEGIVQTSFEELLEMPVNSNATKRRNAPVHERESRVQ